MPTHPDPPVLRYRWPARLLHWGVALIVLGMIPVGIVMGRLDGGPLQDRLFELHESFGFTLLALVLLRLAYRLSHTPPPLPASIRAPQRIASELVHIAIYILLLVMPILGWLGASAYGAPVSIFGVFDLPQLLAKNEPLSDRIFSLHETLGLTLGVLVLVHIGAAILHGAVLKDGVVRRMWPP